MHSRMKRVKKFYDSVQVERASSGLYQLLLNGKTLKTPLGANMKIPSEGVAVAAATEWELQHDYVIPNTMPINTIVMTHLDIDSNTERLDKVKQINRFFQTDTIRFPELESSSKLARFQQEKWKPIFDYLSSRGVVFSQSSGGFSLPETTEAEIERVHEKIVDQYDGLKLTMLDTAAKYLKSGSIGIGLIEGVLTPEQAFEAAFVEELDQRTEWGLVGGDHDLNDAENLLWLNGISLLGSLLRHK
jgi:ATP synthase F1 complex assembly factor 2